MYFSKESGLTVMTATIIHSQMGPIPAQVYPGDYRKVNGITLPFKSEIKVMGQGREITLESVEFNVEIPEGLFEPPAEVKSLLEKAEPVEE
jgi:hypothetical protein